MRQHLCRVKPFSLLIYLFRNLQNPVHFGAYRVAWVSLPMFTTGRRVRLGSYIVCTIYWTFSAELLTCFGDWLVQETNKGRGSAGAIQLLAVGGMFWLNSQAVLWCAEGKRRERENRHNKVCVSHAFLSIEQVLLDYKVRSERKELSIEVIVTDMIHEAPFSP